jgi:DNA-binding transcriptional LysR family regulator
MRHHISLGLDDLRTVVALAEELNYHRAARRVGKTQSGVTRAVARVEKHVGTRLFERSHSKNHSVATTDAGVHYVARARLAIAHSESAELAARESLHGVNHQINVGKSVFTDRRLLTILRSIELPLHPGLEVRLHTRSPAELPSCVRSGEFDLAIVSNSVEDSLLSGTAIRCIPFTVVLPEGHSCAAKEYVTLTDLSSTPWVLFERHLHPALYDSFLDRANQLGIKVELIHHIADAEEACEIVRLYGGAAFLSPQGAERAATDEVILRTLAEKQVFLKTQILARSENTSKLIAEFVRTFVKRLKQAGLYQPALLEFEVDVQRAFEFPTKESQYSQQVLTAPLDHEPLAEPSKAKVCAA